MSKITKRIEKYIENLNEAPVMGATFQALGSSKPKHYNKITQSDDVVNLMGLGLTRQEAEKVLKLKRKSKKTFLNKIKNILKSISEETTTQDIAINTDTEGLSANKKRKRKKDKSCLKDK